MAAAVVSHAMRRFSITSPDNGYAYGLRVAESPDEPSSSLSRSMRYADPWLYGTVRAAPSGLVLTPAFALCECSDYQNGTKRSTTKKTPTTCKKCKGTRLPLAKFGTVRCYPSAPTVATTQRSVGTVRLSTPSSRASILPAVDPYDLMRRSRLAISQQQTPDTPKITNNTSTAIRSQSPRKLTLGRKSILECDINPYELMSTEREDSGVTLVNGQRIRVRPVEEQSSKTKSTNIPTLREKGTAKERKALVSVTKEKESSECNGRFKSILKKPPSTFSDTDLGSGGAESSPSPTTPRSGSNSSTSHFYLPMPVRKKVQFLVENEIDSLKRRNNRNNDEAPSNSNYRDEGHVAVQLQQHCRKNKEKAAAFEDVEIQEECVFDETPKPNPKPSAPFTINSVEPAPKVQFYDTMSLNNRNSFAHQDLERLDGLTPKTRRKSPTSPRPNEPPPPPPIPQIENAIKATPKVPEPEKIIEELPKSIVEEIPTKEEKPEIEDHKNDLEIDKKDEAGSNITIYEDIEENFSRSTTEEEPVKEEPPPSVPPRKKSNNKQPCLNLTISTPALTHTYTESNKTVVQIVTTPPVHKIQIKNEFPETINIQTVSVLDNPQRKTSIMITGDDCYSTVNVNDDIPLYQSSVVVKDCAEEVISPNYKQSSSVYITGNFMIEPLAVVKEDNGEKDFLKDPVEAVKRNLVPHVCGKSDVESRHKNVVMEVDLDDSLLNLGTYEHVGDDVSSEHSSSTQYELMDASSECYTDHSNRSSVTEEELAGRTKFYELLADSALAEVSENEDHHYESIRLRTDPIYEEIEIPPPLPKNPPPSSLIDDIQLDKEYTTRSIFEGASKYDILSYLVDAKERGIVQEDSYNFNFLTNSISGDDDSTKGSYNRASHMSDSSEDSSLVITGALTDDKFPKTADVERNDSGVGSETSKSSLSKYRSRIETSSSCEDCEQIVDTTYSDTEPLLCRKCAKKRSEKKEIIAEIVETEEKYSRDLQIILEEFYQPMLVAGLLTPEQLSAIFLNVEELLENSQALAERLRDAVEIASEQGDEDLQTVNMGKLFLEAAPMLHAFETYCVRQGGASLLLASLEKEKELLRIFLRVSQMENALLRRMNLNSFLMVPVQRVTKYPLLLARLYKVTPSHFETKEQLKEAQHKIELHLNHMNSQTKDVPSKLWRRIGSSSGRRASTEMDLVNIKLRKIAVDVLEWNHDEAKFALEGKLLFTQPTDNNWRKGRTIKLTPINALLVINGKFHSTNKSERSEENGLIFSRHSMAREAALLLVRDKNGRYSLLREPLFLDRCIIAADPAWQSYFEVQELLGKDTFIFKAEDEQQTKTWYSQLQYHAQGMGSWRKRRNALANIMINGMGLRS